MAFDPKSLGEYKQFLDTQSKISKVMSKSSKDFASGFKDAIVAQRDLNKAQKQYDKLLAEDLELQKKINKAKGEEKQLLLAKQKVLKEELATTKQVLEQQKALTAALGSQVKSVKNLTLAVGRDLVKGFGKVLSKAKDLGKEFTGLDDSMRRTAVNVGVVGKQFNQLRKTAYKAALVTDRIGVGAKELVEMYGSYVDEVGRLIPLTQNAGKAMAYMSKGTALGAQGAAQMAASMEVFGMSIESTAKYVGEVSNMSEKMGVNSGKVLKVLQSNLRKAQTINFKGGVQGMAKMAAKATAIRADMASTLGFAQELWNPEKAIDTAAQLQMMGGAFAKMADPIKLMFDARNNPGKIMEDLASSAASVVKRSKDGVYSIPTMELQRLKQVAEATSQDFESIVEQAKTMAKRNDIGKALDPRIKGEARDFIKSIAEMKDGKLVVDVGGKAVRVSNLGQQQIAQMMKQDKSLKERAEQSQSFMTGLKNMLMSLKNLAMSFFAGMEGPLRTIMETLTGSGDGGLQNLSDQVFRLGEQFGTWIATGLVPFVQGAIPLMKSMVGKLTEMVTASGTFIKDKLIPTTKQALAWLKSFWEENGPFIKKVLGIVKGVGKLVWGILGKINDVFGAKGVLAAILLVKFPGILKGAFSMLKGMTQGLGKMFGGGAKGTMTNPMIVQSIGGGVGGGGGGGGVADLLGNSGMSGRGLFGRLGNKKGRSVIMRAAKMGKGGLGTRLLGGGMNMLGKAGKFGAKGLNKVFGKKLMGGVARMGGKAAGMAGGTMARLGTGMAKGGPLALLGVGAEVGRMFMDDPDSMGGKALGVLGTTASDAAMGMMVGSLLGPMGTAIGGIIGGIVGFGRSMYREITTKGKDDFNMSGAKSDMGGMQMASSGSSYMGDGAVFPNGNVIKTAKGKMYRLSPKDIVSVGQPGGGSSYGGGGGTMNVNISGTINLGGGGTSVSLDGLINDPVFKAEITKVVVKNMKEQNR